MEPLALRDFAYYSLPKIKYYIGATIVHLYFGNSYWVYKYIKVSVWYVYLQDVNRHTPISPINSSEQYYLLDVIAFILKYLKDQLYQDLTTGGLDMSRIQFDWVVTVPAIWDIRGKQMMREAAYNVSTYLPKILKFC